MKRAERAVATSLVPSADEATENQSNMGALVESQVKPELVETIIGPGPLATATNFAPSAEDATACQLATGAVVWVQSCAETELRVLSIPASAAALRAR